MISKLLFASIVGLLAHQLVFIRGEWHLLAPTIFSTHIILALLLIGANLQFTGSTNGGTADALALIACYLMSLFTSIAIYRIYFHQLRHFPGPRLAALSKLWHVWQCRDSRNHLVLEKLHQEYGSFVRTGEHSLHAFTTGSSVTTASRSE